MSLGVNTSSSIYNSLIEGRPIRIRIREGEIVQNNSNCWDSTINLLGVTETNIEISEYEITEIIRIIRVIVWSWKKTNCSIKGE